MYFKPEYFSQTKKENSYCVLQMKNEHSVCFLQTKKEHFKKKHTHKKSAKDSNKEDIDSQANVVSVDDMHKLPIVL